MRFLAFLPFVGLSAGFILVDEKILGALKESGKEILETSRNALDEGLGKAASAAHHLSDKVHDTGFDVDAWLAGSPFSDSSFDDFGGGDHPPHDPHNPDHPPPPHPPHDPDHPHHPPHHGKPHHPPHHGKPNHTVYELISKSKYTTKLAELINDYPDLVETLNGTKANYTIFAPTDEAFEKIPEHGKKPSKEFLKDILLYHISDDFYPAGRVLHSYTIPSLFKPDGLGHAQRLTVRLTLHGPAINFYSKIVAVNIFGTNGVIHGVDHILVPPPRVVDIIDLLPGEFSTLELALGKTGLLQKMNETKYPHTGGTFFAPSNWAFKKLGPKINAFLFSKYGQKYLKALLEYHIVVNQTLYSDAFFDGKDEESETGRPPYYHLDLPTVLYGKPLAVDVVCHGPFVFIRINGFSKVTIHDGVAKDGVIQVVSDVLIPPKKMGSELVHWKGEELSVEELKERLDPIVENEDNMEL
ncbi:FAS1 domain-containing protein [Delitschia confertaspora ATCC 74209]|uniref:FAS1 domain-containing protein n=1 Tax=Delitschia confertaspora ATCC 74209 TaxID=1513339 RepID=A0A9P4JM40_9PLEO|nr:FAS1 domain-containing protein [Delitschia confertaspora ATCC 74209]